MKRSILTVLLAVVLSGIAASAQGDKKDQSLITLELKDSPIKVALDSLFLGKGLNYVVDQSVSGTVGTLSLKEVPFDQALKVLLKSADPPLVYRKDGDVYIISVKKEEPLPNPGIDNLSTRIPDEPIPANDIKMEKIALNCVDAFDLKDLIQGGDTRNSGSAGGFGGMGGGMNSGFGGMSGGMGGFGGGMGGFGGGFGGMSGGYGGSSGYGGSGYGGSGYGGGGFGGAGGYRGSRSGY